LKNNKDLLINILSVVLLVLSILAFLILIFYFQIHSPEYLTHEQFYSAMAVIGFAFFAGLLSVWINVSNKLTDFAREMGEIKGSLNQYMKNHSRK
jgi:vacuolar-type H+-ATPase subunit I/STV1